MTKTLDFENGEIAEHFSSGDADCVIDGDIVDGRYEHVCQSERKHERDPSYGERVN